MDGITATTTSLPELWTPFLLVAIVGAAAAWYRPWLLLVVVPVALWLGWRAAQVLPDHDVLEHVADPATRAVFIAFWRHAYAALGTAILVPVVAAILRRRRPAA